MHALNAQAKAERLSALRQLAPEIKVDKASPYVNNHIHTIYSFSPYSPCMALYRAQQAGLSTAGIMDHDSVGGAMEFIEGGKIIGMATTVGIECRVSMEATPFATRRTNNPDQAGNTYVAMHGIPHQSLDMVEAFLRPLRVERDKRNAAMTLRLNEALVPTGINIDYENDVRPLSRWEDGGSVTERHICSAASQKLIERYGGGQPLLDALTGPLGLVISPKISAAILTHDNPYLHYDILGALKSELVQSFYIPATDECPPLADFLRVAKEAGAVSAYPYLGDISDSVTGDKRAQKFEDAYLDELFDYLDKSGFNAVTYMPTRNTLEQLRRVQDLCKRHGFFQISGEDINSPRQSFICKELEMEEFSHLREATWALIGHELAASEDISKGMFGENAENSMSNMEDRIARYAAIGRNRS